MEKIGDFKLVPFNFERLIRSWQAIKVYNSGSIYIWVSAQKMTVLEVKEEEIK